MLVSAHFEPVLENEKLRLRVVNVLGGQLPLPQALWGGYRQKLEQSLREKIPQWQARATIGPDGANRDAVGARLTARVGERVLVGSVDGGGSYISASDRRVHFGFGDADVVDRLEVRWPSGRVESRSNLRVDSVVEWAEEP